MLRLQKLMFTKVPTKIESEDEIPTHMQIWQVVFTFAKQKIEMA